MTLEHPKFKAAAVQAAPAFLDLEACVDKTCALIEEAAKSGAGLIGFPETWIPGYPWWIWLGAPAWGLQFQQRYFDNSMTNDGAAMKRIRSAARANEIHVVLGYSERAAGSLYIAQAFIDSRGELLATRRKLKATHVERTVFGEGDGSGLAVHDTDLGRLGALCCWEHMQPLNRFALFAMNEQVHVSSWPSFSLYRNMAYALGPEVNCAASALYAAEGQCFVIAACALVSQEMLEVLGPNHEGLLEAGGGYAMIYAPDGRPMCDPLPSHEEGILYADIDLGLISLAKAAGDPAGHYCRPDVTRLLLNTESASPVEELRPTHYELDAGAETGDPPSLSSAPNEARQQSDGTKILPS